MPLSRVVSRTESGCLSGLGNTSIGHRWSFHVAITAKTDTTPTIGRDNGRTIDCVNRALKRRRAVPLAGARLTGSQSRDRLEVEL